jgi:hypothetical protein
LTPPLSSSPIETRRSPPYQQTGRSSAWRSRTADLLNGARACVLAVIEHGTRRVRILSATEHPARARVVQQARNLPMDLEDAGTRVKFVLHDRDASFTADFDAVLRAAGIRIICAVSSAAGCAGITPTGSGLRRWRG